MYNQCGSTSLVNTDTFHAQLKSLFVLARYRYYRVKAERDLIISPYRPVDTHLLVVAPHAEPGRAVGAGLPLAAGHGTRAAHRLLPTRALHKTTRLGSANHTKQCHNVSQIWNFHTLF